ncbi:ABC transporter substrate-binding protein, partial [Klebsiella pneumoniae]|nr:ABC transporter substrate-binding protein [Klebsiella pneumoniae]MCP6594696.1 ABC transporter substrate-binding protein [Klebsiella pneumoniae]
MTKDVREALDAVINRQQISDKVADHYAAPANGPFNTKLDFNKDKAIPKQDISKAKALMEKAGYSE